MAMVKTRVVENGVPQFHENGQPLYHYGPAQPDDGLPSYRVQTGPVSGTVTLSDGSVYDVTEEVIEVACHEHCLAVGFRIVKMLEATGRLDRAVHGEDLDSDCIAYVDGDETGYSIRHTVDHG